MKRKVRAGIASALAVGALTIPAALPAAAGTAGNSCQAYSNWHADLTVTGTYRFHGVTYYRATWGSFFSWDGDVGVDYEIDAYTAKGYHLWNGPSGPDSDGRKEFPVLDVRTGVGVKLRYHFDEGWADGGCTVYINYYAALRGP